MRIVGLVNSAWDPLMLLKNQILRLKKKEEEENADAGCANAQSKRCLFMVYF